MRNRCDLIVSGLFVLSFASAAGCKSSGAANPGQSGSGGAVGISSSGGSKGSAPDGGGTGGSKAGGSSCSDVAACGGDVAGTWTVSSSCLQISGELDLSLVGAGCPSVPVTGSLHVTGSWTATGDGVYSDDTMTTGTEQFTLTPSCLIISSTPVTCDGAANIIKNLGYASLACTSTSGGGCDCTATIQQAGGLGLVSVAPVTGGNYTSSGNALTLTGDVGDTSYTTCVAGTKLTLTPQSTKPSVAGTIVLDKAGASGSGGQSGPGSGGRVATGGATGAGGVVGTGGGTGSGGVRGTGGAGSGGVKGMAGSSASGGASSSGGGAPGSSGAKGSGGGTAASGMGPCDIYNAGGTPCVAAHSTVRALFGAYGGKLYQVRNTGGTTKDITAASPGGPADGAAQDAFCSGSTCVITVIYDQSGKGNDLWYQGSDSPVGGKDKPASATGESVKLGGNKVYSLYINPGNSYWVNGAKSGIPLGAAPEGMYMVTSAKHYNSGCCFDYGNSEADRKADGAGAMDAINFSNTTAWGSGDGAGPWIMADLEYGLFAQGDSKKNANDPTQSATFVTATLKNNGTTEFSLRGGDATTGALTTYYKGGLPGGWSPMKKQGAIVLGSGGDCCATNNNLSDGTFYEGCIVSGYPSDATENAVQANIVAAGYSK